MEAEKLEKQKDGESRPIEALVILLIILSLGLGVYGLYSSNDICVLAGIGLGVIGERICAHKLNTLSFINEH